MVVLFKVWFILLNITLGIGTAHLNVVVGIVSPDHMGNVTGTANLRVGIVTTTANLYMLVVISIAHLNMAVVIGTANMNVQIVVATA